MARAGILQKYIKSIIKDYKKGNSITALSKQYTYAYKTIKNLLKNNGIYIRSYKEQRGISYDEKFFFKKSSKLYYMFGFILGDGSLTNTTKRSSYITISLNKKDVSVLQQFCKWLNISNENIKYYKNKKSDMVRLNIYSDICNNAEYMKKFGLVARKTYNPIIPDVDRKYLKPFLLGLIDADGSVDFHFKHNKNGYTLALVGNELIVSWFEACIKKLGFKGNINIQYPKNKWKRIRVQRKNDIVKLSKILSVKTYRNLILPRKWKHILEYLNFYY